MSQDPMVTALQGPQDPIVHGLFPQPQWDPRNIASGTSLPSTPFGPELLMMKGREMLKDPNRPQYDPNNVDRPVRWREHIAGDVVNGPWGSPPRVPLANMGGTEGLLGMTGNVDALNVVPHPSAMTPANTGRLMDILYPLAPFSK